jgi:hypothetical protein
MAKQARRVIMRLELSQKAIDSFITSAEGRGMTHIATSSRIIEWLIAQEEEVIATVVGAHPAPPSPDELARMIVDGMRKSRR